LNIYQIPNSGTPVISCGASMLAVCGDFTHALAHPSGKYVFLTDASGTTDIGAVNLNAQQITQTSSILYPVQEFSPDGTITYATNDGEGEIEIYGFDVATGGVTEGGSFSDLGYLFTAERK
jgi:Tol biopolymer transport system component